MTFVLPEMSFHSRRDKSRALDMSNTLAQVMPKFTENFGMTFARKCTYRAPEICRNENESTFPAKYRSLAIGCSLSFYSIKTFLANNQSPVQLQQHNNIGCSL
jgi:hypothetical protein